MNPPKSIQVEWQRIDHDEFGDILPGIYLVFGSLNNTSSPCVMLARFEREFRLLQCNEDAETVVVTYPTHYGYL
jgi:hypothetical protein